MKTMQKKLEFLWNRCKYYDTEDVGVTFQEAAIERADFLKDKIVGEPRAILDSDSVDQLKAEGYVGIYRIVDEPEETHGTTKH